jgi:hypothetical protein
MHVPLESPFEECILTFEEGACASSVCSDKLFFREPTMTNKLEFPTLDQVMKASHEDLARWYRFLLPNDKEQQDILDKIADRFKKLGGMTPEISKRIGHGGA